MTATGETAAVHTKRDSVALALLGGMFIALAIVGSASLGVVGPSVFQDIVGAIGFTRNAAIETEQRRHAAEINTLSQMIENMSDDVRSLTGRVKLAEQSDVAVSDRFSLVDVEIASLLAEVRDLRSVRGENEPWRDPVERIDGAVSSTNNDILKLRSSLDEHNQAYRKELTTVARRLDRLEHLVTRDLTGSIRTEVRKQVRHAHPAVRRVHVRTAATAARASAAPATTAPANPPAYIFDRHAPVASQ